MPSKKDISHIQLYHFGEPFISTIIKECELTSFLNFLDKFAFLPNGNQDNKSKIINSFRESIQTDFEVKTLVEIASSKNHSFDSEHSIDVSILGKDREGKRKVIPIEVKMGESGVAESWSKFARGMIDRKIEKVILKDNTEESRLKGSMASMLGRFGLYGNDLIATSLDQNYEWENWILCIRLANKKNFIEKFNPDNGLPLEACPLIFCFEELVHTLAKESYPEIINKIMNESRETLIVKISESFDSIKTNS